MVTSHNRDTEVLPRPAGQAAAPDETSELSAALGAAAPRRWWNRTTLALLAVVMLTGGFLGGVQAHERWGTESASTAGGEFPGAAGAASAGGGAGDASRGPAGASGGGAQGAMAEETAGTTGTVKLVDGAILYVETADGETVTVRTSDTTAVKVSQVATLESITSGLAVTVEGIPDSEGIITATTVTAG